MTKKENGEMSEIIEDKASTTSRRNWRKAKQVLHKKLRILRLENNILREALIPLAALAEYYKSMQGSSIVTVDLGRKGQCRLMPEDAYRAAELIDYRNNLTGWRAGPNQSLTPGGYSSWQPKKVKK